MARSCTAKIVGANIEDSLTRCEPKDLEYNIDTGHKSLRIKKKKRCFPPFNAMNKHALSWQRRPYFTNWLIESNK